MKIKEFYKDEEKSFSMNLGNWSKKDIPHKGWKLIDVYDTGGGEPVADNYSTCDMCGNTHVRYVHVVKHPDIDKEFEVGCICAMHMTEDYVTSEKRESDLRKIVAKRTSFLKSKHNFIKADWKKSKYGNFYLKKDGHLLRVIVHGNLFKGSIDSIIGKRIFNTIEECKGAIYESIAVMKSKKQWKIPKLTNWWQNKPKKKRPISQYDYRIKFRKT